MLLAALALEGVADEDLWHSRAYRFRLQRRRDRLSASLPTAPSQATVSLPEAGEQPVAVFVLEVLDDVNEHERSHQTGS
jgi:hypothetical protein